MVDFGIGLFPNTPINDIVSKVQLAEKSGFRCAWVTDQFFRRNIFSVLTTCALKTSEIKLATGVVHPLYRHPALLASGIGTLDEVSNGRAVLGIGAGAWTEVQPLCLNLDKHFSTCKESLEIVKMLLRDKITDYEGEIFQLKKGDWWEKDFAFATGRKIPIFLGARGLKMFELGGRLADGVVTWGMAPEYLNAIKQLIQRGAERASRKASDVQLISKTTYSFNHEEADKNRLKYNTAMLTAGTTDVLIEKLGIDPKTAKVIQDKWKKGDIAGATEAVDERTIKSWHLIDEKEKMIEKLDRLVKAGSTQIVLSPTGPDPKVFIERFGKEVIPSF